jgi:hypothetical protein
VTILLILLFCYVNSGFFKVGTEKCVLLSGHLSTKSCKKVWNLSKSLRRVVEVTKVCRSEVWPKRWEASSPTSDNTGLYLFPYKMKCVSCAFKSFLP